MQDFVWSIVPWGYRLLLQAEGMRRPWLDAVMRLVTDLGSEVAYLVILSLVFIFPMLFMVFSITVGLDVMSLVSKQLAKRKHRLWVQMARLT